MPVLTLRRKTVTRRDAGIFGRRTGVRPYGALGPVRVSPCCCLVCVDADNLGGALLPGTGCDRGAADRIAAALNGRREAWSSATRAAALRNRAAERTLAVQDKVLWLERHLREQRQAAAAEPTAADRKESNEQMLPPVEALSIQDR